jgi:hypothetical protein
VSTLEKKQNHQKWKPFSAQGQVGSAAVDRAIGSQRGQVLNSDFHMRKKGPMTSACPVEKVL